MEVVDDVCESDCVCEVICDVLSDQPEQGATEMHVSEEDVAHMEKCASTGEHAGLSAAACGTEHTCMESQKPRYSYRLVLSFKQVWWDSLGLETLSYFQVVLEPTRVQLLDLS